MPKLCTLQHERDIVTAGSGCVGALASSLCNLTAQTRLSMLPCSYAHNSAGEPAAADPAGWVTEAEHTELAGTLASLKRLVSLGMTIGSNARSSLLAAAAPHLHGAYADAVAQLHCLEHVGLWQAADCADVFLALPKHCDRLQPQRIAAGIDPATHHLHPAAELQECWGYLYPGSDRNVEVMCDDSSARWCD